MMFIFNKLLLGTIKWWVLCKVMFFYFYFKYIVLKDHFNQICMYMQTDPTWIYCNVVMCCAMDTYLYVFYMSSTAWLILPLFFFYVGKRGTGFLEAVFCRLVFFLISALYCFQLRYSIPLVFTCSEGQWNKVLPSCRT